MSMKENEIEYPDRDEEGLKLFRERHGTEEDDKGRPRIPEEVDRVFGYFVAVEEDDGRATWRLYHPKSACYLEGRGLQDIVKRTPCGEGSILDLKISDESTVRVVCPGAEPQPLAGSYESDKSTPWHDW